MQERVDKCFTDFSISDDDHATITVCVYSQLTNRELGLDFALLEPKEVFSALLMVRHGIKEARFHLLRLLALLLKRCNLGEFKSDFDTRCIF